MEHQSVIINGLKNGSVSVLVDLHPVKIEVR